MACIEGPTVAIPPTLTDILFSVAKGVTRKIEGVANLYAEYKSVTDLITKFNSYNINDHDEKVDILKQLLTKLLFSTGINPLVLTHETIKPESHIFTGIFDRYLSSFNTNPNTLAYYEANAGEHLTTNQVLVLSMQPVLTNFYLDDLLKTVGPLFKYIGLLDCLFVFKDKPTYFTDYGKELSRRSIQFADLEFIFSLVIGLIMLDMDSKYDDEWNAEGTKIVKVNNIFSYFFKYKHLDLSSVTTVGTGINIVNNLMGLLYLFSGNSISGVKEYNTLIETLIDKSIITPDLRNKCTTYYTDGELTLGKYLILLLKDIYSRTPILSLFTIGIYDSIFNDVLNRSRGPQKQQTGGGFEDIGLTLLFYILDNPVTHKIYSTCVRKISHITSTFTKQKYTYASFIEASKNTGNLADFLKGNPFIAILLKTMSITGNITTRDKSLLFPKANKDNNSTSSSSINPKYSPAAIISEPLSGVVNEMLALPYSNTAGVALNIFGIAFKNLFSILSFKTALDNLLNESAGTSTDELSHMSKLVLNMFYSINNSNNKRIRRIFIFYICYMNIYGLCYKYYRDNNTLTDVNKDNINKIASIVTEAIYSSKPEQLEQVIIDCFNSSETNSITTELFKIIKFNYAITMEKQHKLITNYRIAFADESISLSGGGKLGSNLLRPFQQPPPSMRKPILHMPMQKIKPSQLKPFEQVKLEPMRKFEPSQSAAPNVILSAVEIEGLLTVTSQPNTSPEELANATPELVADPVALQAVVNTVAAKISERDIKLKDIKSELKKVNTKQLKNDIIENSKIYNQHAIKAHYETFIDSLFRYNMFISSTILMSNLGVTIGPGKGIFKCDEYDFIHAYITEYHNNQNQNLINFMIF